MECFLSEVGEIETRTPLTCASRTGFLELHNILVVKKNKLMRE
jgi:hypothetical protein